mmetsp:Transcript_13437/g.26796  ORF Transcript_13437/g.26796 Transcript_13437/m.26796 type:complete len:224 (+) Transcript_13437:1029-1700(+)
MRRHIRQTHSLEIREGCKTVLLHKRGQFCLHALDHGVPMHHDTRAHLDSIRTQQNKFCGIISSINTTNPRQRSIRISFRNHLRYRRHACQCNGFDSHRTVSSPSAVSLHARLWSQGVQIDAHDRFDRINRSNTITPSIQTNFTGNFNIRNIWCHFRPHWNRRSLCHPPSHLCQQLTILSHGHSHAPLRHTMRAAKINLKRIHPCRLTQPNQLDPRLLVILLHD